MMYEMHHSVLLTQWSAEVRHTLIDRLGFREGSRVGMREDRGL
jgi:hypothetical protein